MYERQESGSVVIGGDSPLARYRVVVSRGHNGPIFDAEGKQLGTMQFEIREPGPGAAAKKPEKLDLKKPGDFLAHLISKVMGYSDEDSLNAKSDSCDCNKIRKEMNDKGWLWCLTHRNELVDRVVASASKKGVRVDRDNIWTAFTSAWDQRGKDSE